MKVKLTLFSLLALLTATTAWADVEINATNFPNKNFRSWVLEQDYGADGVLTAEEIAGVTSIDVKDNSIRSLKGIEYFTALTYLDCSSNQLTSLDVSKNTALKELRCGCNHLTSLDVSNNIVLTKLFCNDNQLTALNVLENTALTWLSCSRNQLTSLDVSQNIALTRLSCFQNQIKGKSMYKLVKSLPKASENRLVVINIIGEKNKMNRKQAAAAKAKGWIPKYYDGKKWREYTGKKE